MSGRPVSVINEHLQVHSFIIEYILDVVLDGCTIYTIVSITVVETTDKRLNSSQHVCCGLSCLETVQNLPKGNLNYTLVKHLSMNRGSSRSQIISILWGIYFCANYTVKKKIYS